MFPTGRRPLEEAGFTLAEVMIAVAVLTIGLLAIGVGFQHATSGVATGRGETTAVFLAEQRIEQLKAQALINFSAAALAAGTTTDYCAGGTACQGSPVSGPSYTRTTTITDIATGVAGGPATPLPCEEGQVPGAYRPGTSSRALSMLRTLGALT